MLLTFILLDYLYSYLAYHLYSLDSVSSNGSSGILNLFSNGFRLGLFTVSLEFDFISRDHSLKIWTLGGNYGCFFGLSRCRQSYAFRHGLESFLGCFCRIRKGALSGDIGVMGGGLRLIGKIAGRTIR